ncbi:MAG: Xaa-Pro peptidase family protein [Synergistaceae bacterium]|jgi:Xaa-Pro aminopeptidase|nr:Xaa-Pro peptidase family protein [Synergistaceae bacterium]
MLHVERIERLAEILSETGLDALYLGPSTDVEYLAELRLFHDERVKGLMVSSDGRCFAMTPLLYKEEMGAALGDRVTLKVWADSDGFRGSFRSGCEELGLIGKKIAVNDGVRAVDLIDMKNTVDAEFVNGTDTLSPLRKVKDETELGYLRRAGAIADEVMEYLAKFIRAGMSEREVQEKIVSLYNNAHGVELSFHPIVASGPGGSMPHYSRNDRILTGGDFVVVDMGCRYNGYCSDTTRTFFIGEPSAEQRRVYEIVLEAQRAGETAVRSGATGQDVDRTARKIIEDAGYGDCFLNRLGHGVGIAIHEEPYIVEGNDTPLQPGNVFSVEPGIYIAGKYGVRIENLVAVRPDGTAEALNNFTREMIMIK